MLWVKSLHIVFIASWFSGLFYLPRIFVNLAMVPPESIAERKIRERLAFLVLPPAEAQRMISFVAHGPLRDVTGFNTVLRKKRPPRKWRTGSDLAGL